MNKEQLRKELEDATEWGFNHNWINFKTWASDRDTYITTRLAALDDGDWKENFKEWYYATEEERSDMVSAEQCVEWIEKNIIGLSGEDWISVEEPPDIGDEYLVVYDLEDGDEPLTTAMQFDARENKWYDERGAGVECKTVLFWMPLPEPPKP